MVHQEKYDDADHDLYETECIYIDEEGDRFETETYSEWAPGLAETPNAKPAPGSVLRRSGLGHKSACPRALGAVYQWQFKKSPVNAIHMGDTAIARRLRRPPT